MDHHCPWVQNCIAANNYGQYIQLLLAAVMVFMLSLACFVVFVARGYSNGTTFNIIFGWITAVLTLLFICGVG